MPIDWRTGAAPGLHTTSLGLMSQAHVDSLLRMHNATLLRPGEVGEEGIMKALIGCSTFVTTWGTSFLKNHYYLGTDLGAHKRQRGIIYVEGQDGQGQWGGLCKSGVLLASFRSATFEYFRYDASAPPAGQRLTPMVCPGPERAAAR